MDKFLVGVAWLFGMALLLLMAVFIGPLVGAFSAWILGMAFPETMGILVAFMHVTAPWQTGFLLGVVGSFLTTKTTVNK